MGLVGWRWTDERTGGDTSSKGGGDNDQGKVIQKTGEVGAVRLRWGIIKGGGGLVEAAVLREDARR